MSFCRMATTIEFMVIDVTHCIYIWRRVDDDAVEVLFSFLHLYTADQRRDLESTEAMYRLINKTFIQPLREMIFSGLVNNSHTSKLYIQTRAFGRLETGTPDLQQHTSSLEPTIVLIIEVTLLCITLEHPDPLALYSLCNVVHRVSPQFCSSHFVPFLVDTPLFRGSLEASNTV